MKGNRLYVIANELFYKKAEGRFFPPVVIDTVPAAVRRPCASARADAICFPQGRQFS
jgi:hypothetical protein